MDVFPVSQGTTDLDVAECMRWATAPVFGDPTDGRRSESELQLDATAVLNT